METETSETKKPFISRFYQFDSPEAEEGVYRALENVGGMDGVYATLNVIKFEPEDRVESDQLGIDLPEGAKAYVKGSEAFILNGEAVDVISLRRNEAGNFSGVRANPEVTEIVIRDGELYYLADGREAITLMGDFEVIYNVLGDQEAFETLIKNPRVYKQACEMAVNLGKENLGDNLRYLGELYSALGMIDLKSESDQYDPDTQKIWLANLFSGKHPKCRLFRSPSTVKPMIDSGVVSHPCQAARKYSENPVLDPIDAYLLSSVDGLYEECSALMEGMNPEEAESFRKTVTNTLGNIASHYKQAWMAPSRRVQSQMETPEHMDIEKTHGPESFRAELLDSLKNEAAE